MPDPSLIAHMEEPLTAEIMVIDDFVGPIMDLCQERRGTYIGMEYRRKRVLLTYDLPLNEIIYDFLMFLSLVLRICFFDYEFKAYEESKLVKLDILINKEEVDALTFIVHEDSAYERGKKMCEKLKRKFQDICSKFQFKQPLVVKLLLEKLLEH